MGRIEKGILGGFSGTVGTVVGGTWKGIAYMRSKKNQQNYQLQPAATGSTGQVLYHHQISATDDLAAKPQLQGVCSKDDGI